MPDMPKTPEIEFGLYIEDRFLYKLVGVAADSRTSVMHTDTIRILKQEAYDGKNLYEDRYEQQKMAVSLPHIFQRFIDAARKARKFFGKEPKIEVILRA
ncbi:hypothetical protein FJZ19_01285 [Candidatus Pacearchaeota archaeon]|nr:hypothetical protein [Candidatus Pacearchaeota archaeon]